MSDALEQLASLIRRETGIALRPGQLPSLAAARAAGGSRHGRRRLPQRAGADRVREALLDRLIDEVTVNETFFFRQRRELDAIDWHRLLEAARATGSDSVRVWVAACASGEEAYTLAMLASEAFAPLHAAGLDPRHGHLRRRSWTEARRGHYGRRALRALDPRHTRALLRVRSTAA